MFQRLGVPAGLAAWTIQDLQAIRLSGLSGYLSGYLSGSSGLVCPVIRLIRLIRWIQSLRPIRLIRRGNATPRTMCVWNMPESQRAQCVTRMRHAP